MQDDVAAGGRKMVTIVDPHVKRDPGYYIFSEAEKAKHYVRNRHESDFDGWVASLGQANISRPPSCGGLWVASPRTLPHSCARIALL